MHVGRISHPHNTVENAKIIAPSAIAANGTMWTDQEGLLPFPEPAAMTIEEVREVIASFAQAAKNAIEAGFNGIELHGANGYLIEQFLNPNTNVRTDGYGGSIENRVHFVTELVNAVVNAIGADKTAIRLSPFSMYNDMPAYDSVYETYDLLTRELNKYNLAYLHVVEYAAKQSDEGVKLLDAIRKNFNNTLILNGGYTADRAQQTIHAGQADLISFGAPFIANPDLPHRMKNNIPLAQPDVHLFFSAGTEGFIDYAPAIAATV
jgi:N-ethylmaleimide reductase